MSITTTATISNTPLRNLKKERIVSYAGTSQFGRGITGTSACGLAALNFVRIVFEQEQSHKGCAEKISRSITAKETIEEITSICAGWSSELHLEVEDICRVPLFDRTLKLVSAKYGRPGIDDFRSLLKEMKVIRSSSAAVITRPPEIIACLNLVGPADNVFVIFDSHPRPDHPDGAGLIFSASIEQTATRLAGILPVDNSLLSQGDLQWQAQLLANFSGHVFVPKNVGSSPQEMTLAIMESSLAVLALRAEVADLKRKNSALTSDNLRLEKEVEVLEDAQREGYRNMEAIQRIATVEGQHSQKSSHRPQIENAVVGPARCVEDTDKDKSSQKPSRRPQNENAVAGPSRRAEDTNRDKRFNDHRSSPSAIYYYSGEPSRDQHDSSDFILAQEMQLELQGGDELAIHMQREFDKEDSHLRAQKDDLANISQNLFECGICFDEQPEGDVIRLEPCGHPFCRTCAKDYVASKLDEHRFPILCPTCAVDKSQGNPGTVTGALVQLLGISEEQYEVWVEMSMVQFSILLHCRKCKMSAFVDRQDYDDTHTLVCPLPNCDYIWCKACQQAITIGGPKHSCDGSSELDHLMKQRGWKYCPSTLLPTLTTHGCLV
ncbi:hypothetical protein BJ138DRAFT_1131141 [Hygrophoropsis aurantiaca]|uniref:Uncharacterized protein n=1 Tax=Hygrophoropsis aurantiaca TaxID=72124 RepID=A0ACB7ZT94_9AGAM|nr:hypothetical protein BJ138DRAFT_1131141 [Hygrophoropsis aurantiaca]